jgi:hypothetical protein
VVRVCSLWGYHNTTHWEQVIVIDMSQSIQVGGCARVQYVEYHSYSDSIFIVKEQKQFAFLSYNACMHTWCQLLVFY